MKRWLILVMLGVFIGVGVVPSAGTAAAAPFSDISSHWARANIEAAVQAKYVSGYPDGTFKPDANVSRAEFLAIVTRASGLPAAAAIEPFEDVLPTHWAVDAINKGIGMGFINPADFGKTFAPDKALTRAEMVKWLVSGLAKGDASFVDALRDTRKTILPFTEYFPGKFKESDIPYIAVARGTRLVGGFPDGSFGPDRTTTRAEVVVLLERYLGVEGTKADAYKSLNELREVGLYGTNVKTIGNAVFPKTDQGVELSFYDAFNVELAMQKPLGTIILRHFLVIDPQLTSVYKDMFMSKEEQEEITRKGDFFKWYSQVTFTPTRDMITNDFSTMGPITGTTFQSRYGLPTKYGYSALSSSGGNRELLKAGNTNTFWSHYNVSLEHRFGVTTKEGRYKGLALLGSELH